MRRSRVKPTLAIAAERAGRLKPNGRLTSYSPLSRFEELEFLVIGMAGDRRAGRAPPAPGGAAARLSCVAACSFE